MLQMKICMAQWDNSNRTNNFTSGRKNCMRNGVYCGPAPIGYDKQGKSINSTFTINSDGYLIRKAFQWKLQGVANCDILKRLALHGLHLRKQRLHEILTNPFYTGLIVNKMLDYEEVEGKHPKIVSREDFLRVQEIPVFTNIRKRLRDFLSNALYAVGQIEPTSLLTQSTRRISTITNVMLMVARPMCQPRRCTESLRNY